jgi:two-component system sensor histidine kinase CpxA
MGRRTGFKTHLNLWLFVGFFLFLGTCLVVANFMYITGAAESRLSNLCEVARTAYESSGPEQLRLTTTWFEQGVGLKVYLLDSEGRDLAGGPARPEMLDATPRRRLNPFSRAPDGRFFIRTGDYSCAVAHTGAFRFRKPPLWIFAPLWVLCGIFAWYVVFRIRRVERALTSFGTGELAVRLDFDTGDPIGRLSRAFNQMAERIESFVDAHRRLCIDISHELRSPLARLRLAVGLARSGTSGAVDRIEAEAARLDDLVEGLLDVARAEVDPATVHCELVEVPWLIADIVRSCSIEARDRDCKLDFQCKVPGIVRGDSELLRRAIENVVRNAIFHSPRHSSIEIVAAGDATTEIVSIRDHGPGVPESALESIFQPFYRLESHRGRDTGGTGLGLAIARRAIVIHGGSIRAENAHPGLLVEIRIPRQLSVEFSGSHNSSQILGTGPIAIRRP